MNSKKIVLIILLTILTTIVVFFVTGKGKSEQSSPMPSISSYNPPKEIKYDSSTDLKQELETVDPQVLDSDFES